MSARGDDSENEPGTEKHVWRKFNFTEWRADRRLKLVSREARSVWLDLCGMIYEAEDMGRLSIDGRPYTEAELGDLLDEDVRVVRRTLKELEKAGVFSRTEDGFIQSRRILREEVRRTSGRSFGKLGGNPALKTGDKPKRTLNPIEQEPESRKKLAAARTRIFEVVGKAMPPLDENPAIAATLDNVLEGWLALYDLDQEIIPVIRARSAHPKPSGPVVHFKYFSSAIADHHRKRTSGLPFGPVPKKPPSADVDNPPKLPTKAEAGKAANAILKAKGQGWFVAWLADAEWNGRDVFVDTDFRAQRIETEAGHILREHGYTVRARA